MFTSTEEKNRCANPECVCGVEPPARYCSDYCAHMAAGAASAASVCQCGHTDCSDTIRDIPAEPAPIQDKAGAEILPDPDPLPA